MKRCVSHILLPGILFISACMSTSPVHAHGVSLFAMADGTRILGTAAYDNHKPMSNASIALLDMDGALLRELITNDKGAFSCEIIQPGAYTLELETLDGHRASCSVTIDPAAKPLWDGKGVSHTISGAELAELRMDIHELKESIRLHDVIGGIGYIVGILGLIMFVKGRNAES